MKLLAIFLLIALALIAYNPPELMSQPQGGGQPVPAELRERAVRLHELMKERSDAGMDVSRALELDKQSRDAAKSGDFEGAARLIDEATSLVQGGAAYGSARAALPEEPTRQQEGCAQTVELRVGSDSVTVTSAVPGVSSGRELKNVKDSFPGYVLNAVKGKVKVNISSIPVFIEEGQAAAFKAPSERAGDAIRSPFGGQPTAEYKACNSHYNDVGVKWIRYAGRTMAWDLRESAPGEFDWAEPDDLVSDAYRNKANIVLTVRSFNRRDQPSPKGPKAPADLDGYLNFLTKAVEHYDRNPVVDYWQIENEVDRGGFWGDTPENYAKLLKASYKAIKKANPNAKVLIAGASDVGGFYRFYVPVLEALRAIQDRPGERYFDIFDVHWYGNAGDYREMEGRDLPGFVKDIKRTLSDYGYGGTPVWFTETATHTGRPVGFSGVSLPEQDETAQAAELVKRYVYFLANGVQKVFWAEMVEEPGKRNFYFENVGLITNPRNCNDSYKKLAYFSYMSLIGKLEGSQWEKTERLDLGGNVYAYRFLKNGKRICVLWCDK